MPEAGVLRSGAECRRCAPGHLGRGHSRSAPSPPPPPLPVLPPPSPRVPLLPASPPPPSSCSFSQDVLFALGRPMAYGAPGQGSDLSQPQSQPKPQLRQHRVLNLLGRRGGGGGGGGGMELASRLSLDALPRWASAGTPSRAVFGSGGRPILHPPRLQHTHSLRWGRWGSEPGGAPIQNPAPIQARGLL